MSSSATNLHPTSLFAIDGLVAVITGGGSGIGRVFAKTLAANGAKAVYVVGRRPEPLEETAALGPLGVIVPLQCDVTSKESLASVAARVRADHGYLDLLVANSGVLGPAHAARLPADGSKPSVDEFAEAMWAPEMEEFTQTFHVNVTAMFYSAVAFLGLLDAGNARRAKTAPGDGLGGKNADGVVALPQKSQVIVMTSGAGFNRKVGAGFAYSCSKAATHHLAMMLATYFGPYRIRVNCIAPGVFPSEMTTSRFPTGGRPMWEEGAIDANEVPLMRAATEGEMAGALLYLVGGAGAYVHGGTILTDGGKLGA